MMNAKLKGSAQVVIKTLETLDNKIGQAMAIGLARGLQYAVGVAGAQFASGPRPLKLGVRTGRLRQSITSEVEIAGQRITGRIGDNVVYAAFHEFGFVGVEEVKAHTRIPRFVSRATRKKIELRRSVYDDKHNFVGFKETNQQVLARLRKAKYSDDQMPGFRTINVREHPRRVNYKGRPFIRPALEESLPTITGEINKEVKGVNG